MKEESMLSLGENTFLGRKSLLLKFYNFQIIKFYC